MPSSVTVIEYPVASDCEPSLCSLQAYNYIEHLLFCATSPPTLYTSPTLTCKEPLSEQQVDDPSCK